MLNLIVGRLRIFLLMVTAGFGTARKLSFEDVPLAPFLVFIIAVGMTAVYFLFLASAAASTGRFNPIFRRALLVPGFLQTGTHFALHTLYIVVSAFPPPFLSPAKRLRWRSSALPSLLPWRS